MQSLCFKKKLQGNRLFCFILRRPPSISRCKSCLYKFKIDQGKKKKKDLLFLLRSILLLLPLILMWEAESILKDKHKSGQAHLANMSVILFSLVLLWRKTCDSDQAISSYTVRPTSLADKI